MNQRKFRFALGLLALAGIASNARAEGGDLSSRLSISQESVWLRRPDVFYRGRGAPTYLPRFGIQLLYGLTNWLEAGFGAELSVPQENQPQHVEYLGLTDVGLQTNYWDFLAPGHLAFRWNTGSDFSGLLVLSGGMAFVRWEDLALLRSDGSRYNASLGHSTWFLQTFGRAALLAEWRPASWVAVQLGPHAMGSSQGSLHVGGSVQVDLSVGAGPSI